MQQVVLGGCRKYQRRFGGVPRDFGSVPWVPWDLSGVSEVLRGFGGVLGDFIEF